MRLLRPTAVLLLATFLLVPLVPRTVQAQSLLGSHSSLLLQNLGAAEEGFTFLRTASDVNEFVKLGLLVSIRGNADYELAGVSFPYARTEVKTFIEHLSRRYHDQCGEPLVVTSLTRPTTLQPRNASEISVHPTGMAVDMRRSDRFSCRRWLEATLLALESKGLVEATKEHYPPHYHVSVFGSPYMHWLASGGTTNDDRTATAVLVRGASGRRAIVSTPRTARSRTAARSIRVSKSRASRSHVVRAKNVRHGKSRTHSRTLPAKRYRVGRGETLWNIAHRHGTTVASLKRANRLRGNHLRAGQVLALPTAR